MSRLGIGLRSLLGALLGAGAALLAASLAGPGPEILPYGGLVVLAVALVGLGLGAVASLYAYGAAGVVVIVLTLLPRENVAFTTGDALRLGAFVIGGPFIVLLALRADRARQVIEEARRTSAVAEQIAHTEREAALAARGDLREALRRAEHERTRFEEVAEAVPEPLIVYDAEGRGQYANRAALRLLGRSFYDRPVEEWGRAADPRDERGVALSADAWPQVRARREAFRSRMLVRLPMSNRDLLVDVEGTPIPDGGCVLLLRDVGKEVAERRRLSQFASFVAHELRNPLAVAKARAELAMRVDAVPPGAVNHATRSLESVDAAIGILERLELFSRAESGRLEAQRDAFFLAEAVEASLERLRAGGSDRVVEVEVDRARVLGDRQLTEQAITNLLTNADRYSHPEAPVLITVHGGDPVELRVIDGGPGVTDEVAETIFRQRVSTGRGLGLGLYLVRAAMESQGGTVQLEERRPRAVFTLRWPRAGKG